MEKVLQWATAQQSNDPEVRARAPAPDPKVLAQVLGANTGKDDATLMKEDISVVLCDDAQISIDDKLTALEDFEMLVQNLDNANNISPMGIWPEIAKLYTYEGEEQDEFRGLAALITGTAAQNNTKSQQDFLNNVGQNGMTNLLNLITKSNNFNVRARALYGISGLVSHNGSIYELFVNSDGWKYLNDVLSEDFANDKKDNKILLRSLNLLKCLLYDEIVEEGGQINTTKNDRFKIVKENNTILTVIKKLSTDAHLEVNERIINLLSYITENGYQLANSEVDALRDSLNAIAPIKESLNANEINTLQKFL